MAPRESRIDPRDTVRSGYDAIADEYLSRVSGVRSGAGVRTQIEALVAELRSRLPEGGDALDLGCGAGVPFTQLLSRHFRVTGVDFSSRQLELACQNVSGAKFLHADMTRLELPSDSFDVITAFFSMIHVPRDEHEQLILNIANWIRPGGAVPGFFWEAWCGRGLGGRLAGRADVLELSRSGSRSRTGRKRRTQD